MIVLGPVLAVIHLCRLSHLHEDLFNIFDTTGEFFCRKRELRSRHKLSLQAYNKEHADRRQPFGSKLQYFLEILCHF